MSCRPLGQHIFVVTFAKTSLATAAERVKAPRLSGEFHDLRLISSMLVPLDMAAVARWRLTVACTDLVYASARAPRITFAIFTY